MQLYVLSRIDADQPLHALDYQFFYQGISVCYEIAKGLASTALAGAQ